MQQHDAVHALLEPLVMLEQRGGGHVDDHVLGHTLRDAVFTLDNRAAAGEHSSSQLRDGVITAEQTFDRAADGGLRRNFEDATSRCVHQFDFTGFVEYENAGEDGVEYTAEVSSHGYAARGSPEKKFRVRSRIRSSSLDSKAACRNAALPGSPFE